MFFGSPTAESFGVSAQIGSGVRGGPAVRFYMGSTRVSRGFHEVLRGLRGGESAACCWGYHLSLLFSPVGFKRESITTGNVCSSFCPPRGLKQMEVKAASLGLAFWGSPKSEFCGLLVSLQNQGLQKDTTTMTHKKSFMTTAHMAVGCSSRFK